MAQIEILLEKQLLTIQNREIIASGDVNVDTCIFTFDEAWEGYTYTAVFYQDKTNVQYAVLAKDNTCVIPAAAMTKAGRLYIGVFGVKGKNILTSTLDIIDIKEGAISGNNVSTEPTDDVFLAIIAQYQTILDMVADQNEKLDEVNKQLAEQNALLEKLNVFETEKLEYRMSAMEMTLAGYGEVMEENTAKVDETLQKIEDSAFLIEGVQVTFDDNGQFKLEDERITKSSVVNAYFGVIEVESLLKNNIYVESFDGYILFTSSIAVSDTYECTIEVRRY